jgi:hypothetical protein
MHALFPLDEECMPFNQAIEQIRQGDLATQLRAFKSIIQIANTPCGDFPSEGEKNNNAEQ